MLFDIFTVASVIGGFAFALSGYLVGVRKQLDFMGIFIVSMLTANGGGAIRDVLVNRVPDVLSDPYAVILVIVAIIIASIFKLHNRSNIDNHALLMLSDAIGLAAFSVTGALIGIEAGLPLFGVMTIAFITAAGGGILRDVLVNETPKILSSDFYGMIALIIAGVIYALHLYDLDDNLTLSLVFGAALVLRIIAYKLKWRLPHISPGGDN